MLSSTSNSAWSLNNILEWKNEWISEWMSDGLMWMTILAYTFDIKKLLKNLVDILFGWVGEEIDLSYKKMTTFFKNVNEQMI